MFPISTAIRFFRLRKTMLFLFCVQLIHVDLLTILLQKLPNSELCERFKSTNALEHVSGFSKAIGAVNVTIGLHHLRRHVGLPRFFSLPSLHHSPCTIRSSGLRLFHHVRYDLAASFALPCTISISEPRILRYLVLGEFRSLST